MLSPTPEPPARSLVVSDAPSHFPVPPASDSPQSPVPSDYGWEEKFRQLDERLARLERHIGVAATATNVSDDAAPQTSVEEIESPEAVPAGPGLESEIGEFWLSRVGVVALIVGLAFLVTYPFAGFPAFMPSVIGYVAVVALFWLARLWKNSHAETARILFSGALFLLFFATLRLHFFSASPAVESRAFVLVLVGAVLVVQMIVAVRRASELTAMLVTILGIAAGMVSQIPEIGFATLVVAAGVSVWLYRSRHWWQLGLLTLVLVYASHLQWLLGNPAGGNAMRGLTESHANLAFLAVAGALLVATGLTRPQEDEPAFLRIVRSFGNGAGLLMLGLLNVRMFHLGQPPWVQLGLAAGFLVAATAYWWHHRGRYGTAVYACFGYLALSAGIMAWFPAPQVYSWLAWQSLLVAATAVLFCSKIIIVTNLFIFGGIYVAYFVMAPASGGVNLSFALVALLIARILNWQKERLAIHTELMRNTYLAAATVIIPYGLYHTVPKSLVSTSWLLAAVCYFAASIFLESKKYRWMGITTIFATIGYVFIIDLSQLQPAYRIVSFLILGVVLIVFSLFYARQRKRDEQKP